MSKRFVLTGLVLVLGFSGLNAQIPRPKPMYPQSVQRPASPSSSQNNYAPAAQPAATAEAPRPTLLAESMDQIDDKRKLVVGDRLSFRIVQDRDPENKALVVTDMGEVQFPLIGRVKAVNKSMKQLAYEVKQLMDRDYYYDSTVLIGLDSSSKFRGRIYITGNVAGQGPQDIPPDEVFTVSKAILRAGGFGDFADQRKVKLIRKGFAAKEEGKSDSGKKKEEVIVDCKAIFQGDPDVKDPVVEPDDMIVVPAKWINL